MCLGARYCVAMFRELASARELADETGYVVESLTPLLARAEGHVLEPALRGRLSNGAEAVIGQLYSAILVARLVGLSLQRV